MNTAPIQLPGCTIDEVQVAENQLMIRTHTHSKEAKCPTCDTDSARVHNYYQRTPRDLPVSECGVRLQRYRVVDLLSDRTAKKLVDWLRDHPGVDIIAQGRSTEYAKGIADGASAASPRCDTAKSRPF